MPKMTLKQAMPKIQEMHHKHTDLMWYARSYPEGHPELDKCDPKVKLQPPAQPRSERADRAVLYGVVGDPLILHTSLVQQEGASSCLRM